MAKVGGGGLGGVRPPVVMYRDVAELQALKSDLDKGAPRPRLKFLRIAQGLGRLIWSGGEKQKLLLDPPELPPGWTGRPDSRQLQALLRKLVSRHGGSLGDRAQGARGPEARMVAALRALLDARDRVQVQRAEATKA